MFLLLASLVTLAAAAPHTLPEAHFTKSAFKQYFQNIFPDKNSLGVTMNTFNILYDSAPWTITSTGTEYTLSMPMSGYQKEDIAVMAHTGILAMRAIHKERGVIKKSETSLNFLPLLVNPAGWWTYHDGVLKVTFPINGRNTDAGATRDVNASDVEQIVLDGNN
ncbi:uncharacterized protein LOC115445464 [Manduca sexta]|uniref:uncharacterized protein LOC115445464 n=1 Tax=Manduca sexta TaxID=7130 RepID=UPI00188ED86F|nr:uncharacterized protein LOC115445464 [Manduca sexta]